MGRMLLAAMATLLVHATAAVADRSESVVGGDTLVSGGRLEETAAAPRDLLVSGAQVVLRGDVGEDVHAAGLALDVEGRTEGDVTASGVRVRLDGPVGGDVTLSAFIATLDEGAAIEGNARVFAGTATQRGTVAGSLFVAAADVRLDGLVVGDVHVLANGMSFGPDARVEGRLVLTMPEEVPVPEDVAPSARVSYRYMAADDWVEFDAFGWEGMPEAPPASVVGAGFLIVLGFLLATGGAFLALMPERVAAMRRLALDRPGVTLLVGAIGLSVLIGLIPVSALSVVGLPLLPLAILLLVVGWMLGYLLGAYVVAMGIGRALGLGDLPGIGIRLAVLAGAIVVATLLNFIPILGWILNVLLVFLGLGAMTVGVLRALMPTVDATERDGMLAHEKG